MVLDTLEILIEADKSGLETQLKRAGQNITNFVSQMNSQEVNWTQILSRSISPAIISGIATMFAMAISKSLQFEDTTKKVGETSGMTGEALATMQEQSKSLARQTGIDANDIARAYGAVVPTFRDAAVANAVVGDAAQLATAGFGSIGDIVSSVLPLMQKWGVTTADEAHEFMNSMADATANSGKSLTDLAAGFDSHSDSFIRAGLKLKDFNSLVTSYGVEVAKIGDSQADAVFAAIGTAIDNSNPALSAMMGGADHLKQTIVNGGIAGAIADIGQKWIDAGAPAQFVAQQFGLTETAVNGFIAGAKKFPEIKLALEQIESQNKSVNDRFNESITASDRLKMAWQSLVTVMTNSKLTDFLASVVQWIANIASGINSAFTAEGWKNLGTLLAKGADIKGVVKDVTELQASLKNEQDQEFKSFDTVTQKLTKDFGGHVFSQGKVAEIENKAHQGGTNDVASLLKVVGGTDLSVKNNQSFINNFNLTVPKGAETLTAQSVADQLYKQFMGTH